MVRACMDRWWPRFVLTLVHLHLVLLDCRGVRVVHELVSLEAVGTVGILVSIAEAWFGDCILALHLTTIPHYIDILITHWHRIQAHRTQMGRCLEVVSAFEGGSKVIRIVACIIYIILAWVDSSCPRSSRYSSCIMHNCNSSLGGQAHLLSANSVVVLASSFDEVSLWFTSCNRRLHHHATSCLIVGSLARQLLLELLALHALIRHRWIAWVHDASQDLFLGILLQQSGHAVFIEHLGVGIFEVGA